MLYGFLIIVVYNIKLRLLLPGFIPLYFIWAAMLFITQLALSRKTIVLIFEATFVSKMDVLGHRFRCHSKRISVKLVEQVCHKQANQHIQRVFAGMPKMHKTTGHLKQNL